MDDIVREAAGVIGPLLSAGVGVTATGMAEEGGAQIYGGIVERVRRRLGSRTPTIQEVAIALDAALSAGEVTPEQLSRLLAREQASNDVTTVRDVTGNINIIGHNTFNGNVG
jgi:hypothetical protein